MKNQMEHLKDNLKYLKLPYILDHFQEDTSEAAGKNLSHLDFLDDLINAEAQHRYERMVQRRIRSAHFPFIKTLDQYQWTHPRKIDRQQIQHLFHLSFLNTQDNIIFIGNTGVGKTHLAIALGYHACCKGHSVLFSSAMDIISHLSAAQAANALIQGLKKYTAPTILLIDEIGYLPIDKRGADLLFQVISKRYERGSIIITSNRPFKEWPRIFNNDSTLTSAILDRLLHHGQASLIDSRSYRMKDRINPNETPQEDDTDPQQADDKDK
jgi:DNA replication protein DnaC